MGIIATLLPSPERVHRVRTAIRDRHEIVECATWDVLLEVCEEQPVHLALVDMCTGTRGAFDGMRRLRSRFPRVTLIAYVAPTLDNVRDIFDAGRAGVDALILAERDDTPRAILAAVEQAEARTLAALLRRELGPDVSAAARDALMLAVTRAHARLTPLRLADLIGVSRRQLAVRLQEANFPPPNRLITWGRLIVAGNLLEDAHRSADRVAAALEFPSGSAFRNTCQRYLGATPQQIRARGGAEFVIRTLLRQCAGGTATLQLVGARRQPQIAV